MFPSLALIKPTSSLDIFIESILTKDSLLRYLLFSYLAFSIFLLSQSLFVSVVSLSSGLSSYHLIIRVNPKKYLI